MLFLLGCLHWHTWNIRGEWVIVIILHYLFSFINKYM
jgi:hypothetical protein